MDVSRFEHCGDGFEVLDLSARLSFRSETSISLDLGRYSDTLPVPGGWFGGEKTLQVGPRSVFTVVGRVDVHHPCEGDVKAQVVVVLPTQYHLSKRMQELVETIFQFLGIPANETFEAVFVAPGQQMQYANVPNRL